MLYAVALCMVYSISHTSCRIEPLLTPDDHITRQQCLAAAREQSRELAATHGPYRLGNRILAQCMQTSAPPDWRVVAH